ADSKALLARTYAAIYQPSNVYTHTWHTGDLVIWDNIALSHRRPPIKAGVARTLRGTEVGDARSVACVAKFGRWFYSRAASNRLKRSSATMRVLTD
ncbi:MAG: TauD/TfdA family dioxygenase, partial [Dactylosporangium sp.]|nr:TauD/TfdA family dioxygenase [Dactylosporangium sp.]